MGDKVIRGKETVVINIPSIDTWNITELRYAAKKNKVKGYTKMNREELIGAVQEIVRKHKGETK